MSDLDDYDYENDSEELPNSYRYERPIFIQNRKTNRAQSKQHARVEKNAECRDRKVTGKKNAYARFVFVEEELKPVETSNPQGSIQFTRKADDCHQYFEYGDSVNGYKFVANEKEFKRFQEAKVKETEPTKETFSKFAFDRNTTSDKDRGSTIQYVSAYWEENKETCYSNFPVIINGNANEIRIDDITNESVKEFYLRSSHLMNVDLSSILKRERLKWHPDRLMGKLAKDDSDTLRKVTKLFQIINELWESL